jgi:hypothetical protein
MKSDLCLERVRCLRSITARLVAPEGGIIKGKSALVSTGAAERSQAILQSDVVQHVRLTVQPIDAPPNPAELERVIDQLGSDDMLLFSTDYPHWQFDGDQVLPQGLPARLRQRILLDNPLNTYPRLREAIP